MWGLLRILQERLLISLLGGKSIVEAQKRVSVPPARGPAGWLFREETPPCGPVSQVPVPPRVVHFVTDCSCSALPVGP